jgi:ribose transport system ATP-binding protein
MTDMTEPRSILEMKGITKRFPGVLALDCVDFYVERGEIHALIGQNGAGKSTLMKILAGDYPPNDGDIFIAGQRVSFDHPRDSRIQGISIVYQELSLLPNLTVAENIFLGREPTRSFIIDNEAIINESQDVLRHLGIDSIDVNQKVETLSLAQQQLVEIAKALSFKPQILILDEPTAALSQADAERLFTILGRLKAQDIAIIYITHRFMEIMQICDQGTILRNGRVVNRLAIKDTNEVELVELMIGQDIESFYRQEAGADEIASQKTILEVENLVIKNSLQNVSLKLNSGEIVGITGLLGAGQNELARTLFGIQDNVTGTIKRNGQIVTINSPRQAIRLGICLLTENRKEEGLFLDLSVKENITIPSLSRFLLHRFLPFLSSKQETTVASSFIEKVNVILSSAEAKMRTLSGGNQQKSILARWLLKDLEVLVFIEPTRGVDVGAKAEIYRYLDLLAKEGRGIIVISPELIEILGISDRILTMHGGNLVREFKRSEATEELVAAAIQGTVSGVSNGNRSQ